MAGGAKRVTDARLQHNSALNNAATQIISLKCRNEALEVLYVLAVSGLEVCTPLLCDGPQCGLSQWGCGVVYCDAGQRIRGGGEMGRLD